MRRPGAERAELGRDEREADDELREERTLCCCGRREDCVRDREDVERVELRRACDGPVDP